MGIFARTATSVAGPSMVQSISLSSEAMVSRWNPDFVFWEENFWGGKTAYVGNDFFDAAKKKLQADA